MKGFVVVVIALVAVVAAQCSFDGAIITSDQFAAGNEQFPVNITVGANFLTSTTTQLTLTLTSPLFAAFLPNSHGVCPFQLPSSWRETSGGANGRCLLLTPTKCVAPTQCMTGSTALSCPAELNETLSLCNIEWNDATCSSFTTRSTDAQFSTTLLKFHVMRPLTLIPFPPLSSINKARYTMSTIFMVVLGICVCTCVGLCCCCGCRRNNNVNTGGAMFAASLMGGGAPGGGAYAPVDAQPDAHHVRGPVVVRGVVVTPAAVDGIVVGEPLTDLGADLADPEGETDAPPAYEYDQGLSYPGLAAQKSIN